MGEYDFDVGYGLGLLVAFVGVWAVGYVPSLGAAVLIPVAVVGVMVSVSLLLRATDL